MLTIRWRSSKGRGEYEYQAGGENVLGKKIAILVPSLESVITTDARFRVKDGKPRLRRDDPNDRSTLNVPPLVAAICALPDPKREDDGGSPFPLTSKSYALDEISFEVVSNEDGGDIVLLKPVAFRPRRASEIDVEGRIEDWLGHNSDASTQLRHLIEAGSSSIELRDTALAVHEEIPYTQSGDTSTFVATEALYVADEIVENYVGSEGKVKIRIHRYKERDRKLVDLAKKTFRLKYGKLFCECCGIDFEETYPGLGGGFMEAHHRKPLSTVDEDTPTTLDDLAMLCANCHRMVHRSATCSTEEVHELLGSSGKFVNLSNIALLESVDDAGDPKPPASHRMTSGRAPRSWVDAE